MIISQLKVLSVANMLGEAIWRIHEESSVSQCLGKKLIKFIFCFSLSFFNCFVIFFMLFGML